MQHKTILLFCLFYSSWLPAGVLEKSKRKCVAGSYYIDQTEENQTSRQERLLSFNQEDSNLKIELNFAIPFLQIPIGGHRRSVENDKEGSHPVIDVNTKSLVTASAFILVVLYVMPKVFKLFLPHSSHFYKGNDRNTEYGKLIHDIEQIMASMKIDADSCWQKTVCSIIQKSRIQVNDNKGSSWDKIIDGLARNDLLHLMVNGSSTYNGIMSGLKDKHCSAEHRSCNFKVLDIISLIRKLPL